MQVIVIPETQSTQNSTRSRQNSDNPSETPSETPSATPSETQSETSSLEVGRVIILEEYETAATRTGKKPKNFKESNSVKNQFPDKTEKLKYSEINSDSDGPVDPIELPSESKKNKVHDESDVMADNSVSDFDRDFDGDFEADSALYFTSTSTPCMNKSSESRENQLGCRNCEILKQENNTEVQKNADYEKIIATYSLKLMKKEIEISNAQREIQKLKTEIQQHNKSSTE